MAKKKIKSDSICFIGESSNDVTGSQYLVKFGNSQCLLECGLYQSKSNSYLDSYRINSEKFKFKPHEIDYVFVAHPHIDHCGLLPRLVREGFNGKIIVTQNTFLVMKSLLMNCAYIVCEEAKILSKRYHREYRPLYDEEDVKETLRHIEVYDKYHEVYQLNDEISFQWMKNSHCLGAAQLQLICSNKMKTRKILYTSDIGALHTRNHYLDDTEIPDMFNDITIMESTYGSKTRTTNKTREDDVEHLKSAIQTVLDRGGNLIFPCFSFSRTQEILTIIYELFGTNKGFNYPVIVDSKLSCEISKLYSSMLTDDRLSLWESVLHWKNVKFISEKTESQECLADDNPKIIISSSGFCTNGRIIKYLQKYLKDSNSMIVFSGYTGDNQSYLSFRIKNFRNHKTISINKVPTPNKADCITLTTLSSHANHDDLVKYGSSLKTNKLILVHGSAESKNCLMADLKESISKNNETYRVLASSKGMVVHM